LKQEIEFPPSQPSAPPTGEDSLSFWEELCAVPENQWAGDGEKGFRVYLYDHDSPGSKYLAVIFHPFDIEWIKQNYGGGRYRAQLNDSSGRIVSKEIFSIDGDSRRKPPQNAQASGVPQPSGDSFQSELLRMMREEQAETRRLFSELMNRQNPAPPTAGAAVDPTTLFRGMVEMFKEFMPAQKPMDLLETVTLLDKLRGPDLLTVLTQAKTAGLIPAAGRAGGDLMGQLNGVIEVAEKIGLSSGRGGKSLGEAVIEKLPEILDAGGKALDKYHQIENARLETARQVRVIQQQRNGTVITPPPQPAAGQMPQHAGAQPHPAPAQQAPFQAAYSSGLEVEAPGTAAADAIAEAERQDAFIKGKIVEMISNGDSGGEIIDFLDKINREICNSFANASADQISYFFSNDPVLKKAVGLPRFKAAIIEIVEELNAPDEEMETPPKAVN